MTPAADGEEGSWNHDLLHLAHKPNCPIFPSSQGCRFYSSSWPFVSAVSQKDKCHYELQPLQEENLSSPQFQCTGNRTFFFFLKSSQWYIPLYMLAVLFFIMWWWSLQMVFEIAIFYSILWPLWGHCFRLAASGQQHMYLCTLSVQNVSLNPSLGVPPTTYMIFMCTERATNFVSFCMCVCVSSFQTLTLKGSIDLPSIA